MNNKKIYKSEFTTNYLKIDEYGYIRNKNLSLKAKGLLTLMLANDEDFNNRISELITFSKDEQSATRSALQELIKYNYVYTELERDRGQIVSTNYYVSDKPFFLTSTR